MTEPVESRIDKADWGDGPWQYEPDRVHFDDPATRLPCRVERHAMYGHLCGYVGLPVGHPWFEAPIPLLRQLGVRAYGGLNCARGDRDQWWIGFDTMHTRDYSPGQWGIERRLQAHLPGWSMPLSIQEPAQYKTLAFVRRHVGLLAAQARDLHR
jgi:hypothetical protein